MATFNYDKPTRTLTVVFAPAEDAILLRVARTTGPQALKQLIETWLIQQAQSFSSQDIAEIKSRIERASATELDAVKTALGVT